MSTWLLSRHPILRSGTLFDEHTDQGFAVWADIRMHGDTFRVYGLHLKSNRITSETEELMDDIRFRERATWIRVQDILSKYGKATAVRAAQGMQLRTEIDNSPHPVILMGDFNDTPFSRAYQEIREGMLDSFVEAGKGIGTTYAGQLPALRIDYILAGTAFRVLSHETPRWDYSDHYPVIASLALRQDLLLTEW
jgi:endonuclease/exonuclease/phosphatase family metal-dependent hydrolase